ncbi:MAG: hypothetical protein ABSB15_10865 [Bryobacteraceae bacterium]
MKAANPVYLELIDFIVSRTTPEAMLQFRPSEVAQHRLAELIEGQDNGTLSAEETSELDDFVQIEHLLIMAKAQARRRMQLAGGN